MTHARKQRKTVAIASRLRTVLQRSMQATSARLRAVRDLEPSHATMPNATTMLSALDSKWAHT
eukprot:5600488-Amphidinium_carterae.1